MEKYISGQKGYDYEKTGAIWGGRRKGRGKLYCYDKANVMPVIVIDEEKTRGTQNCLYNSLY